MIVTQQKTKNKTIRRRLIAIVAAILLIAILSGTLALVLAYAKIEKIVDPADGTTYYIRNETGVYLLYDKEKNIMPNGGVEGKDYFKTPMGTLIEVDPETGEAEIVAAIDVPDASLNEKGTYSSILPYPNISQKQIRSLEIVNSHGSFRLARYNAEGQEDDTADLSLVGYSHVPLDKTAFARLYSSAGYPLCNKLENPKKDANGAYTEYGLAPEIREDEDGEPYEYVPDFFIMTDTSGKQYKMLIGDELVTGQGYYVQYWPQDENGNFVPRDVVYILGSYSGESLKKGVEDLIAPVLCRPMNSASYYKIRNLMVLERDESKLAKYDSILPSVSYIPLEERRNTVNGMRVYQYTNELSGLIPDADQINASMNNLYSPKIEKVVAFDPSPEELAKYGLYRPVLDEDGNPVLDEKGNVEYEEAPAFRVNFDYPETVTNSDGTTTVKSTTRNYILISPVIEENEEGELVETGNYYTYTYYTVLDSTGKPQEVVVYPWVNEVQAETLSFLTWNRFDWTDEFVFSVDLAYFAKLSLSSGNYSASFDLDNSKSTAPEGVLTIDHLSVSASDSNGNATTTFSGIYNLHSYQTPSNESEPFDVYWEVTSAGVSAYDKNGRDFKVTNYYYENNVLGTQVMCLTYPIYASDGTKVHVHANTVEIEKDGKTTTYTRYDTSLFNDLYYKLMFVTSGGSYELSEEDEAALIGDPANLFLTLEVVENEGSLKRPNLVTHTYRFYSLSSVGSARKLYMTVDGVGGFYVRRTQMEELISDTQRFFAGQPIQTN